MNAAVGRDPARVDRLIERVAVGDLQSCEALYDLLAAPVYGLAMSLTGDDDTAADIVAATFTDIWATAASCPPGGALVWAMAIAYHHIRAHPQPSVGRHHLLAGGPACGLSDGQRTSIMLAVCGRLTYRQAARVMGRPAHTVATWQRDGLLRLALRPASGLRPDG